MGLDISGTPAYALVKAYVGTKPGNQAFDFAVVKDHGMRLVAEQSAEEVCVEGGEKVAGNVDEVRLYPKCPPNGAAGVVPGQRFVAGDVDGLPNGFGVAHQATKALGKIRVVGEGPQGEAVPVHNNGLARQHTANHLPASLSAVNGHRNAFEPIGVAGAHNGDWKIQLAVSRCQQLLTFNFVPRVLPVRVFQRGVLPDLVVVHWLLISGCGADKNILSAFFPEQLNVAAGL